LKQGWFKTKILDQMDCAVCHDLQAAVERADADHFKALEALKVARQAVVDAKLAKVNSL
jgi:hypothetical protein